MKNASLCLAFLAVIGVLVAKVESRSPRKCPPVEHCYPCEDIECDCGTYKDECNCCDLCLKCKYAPCSVLAGDVCEGGYNCGDPTRGYLEQIQNPATCIRAAWNTEH